ncbi:MAG: hypothetical protein CEN88_257 [Candidatus Berkelbacteria bacterium Licking1014_2]|uniref:Uncharacterized protein n=1 Tax=Candidatus Berkelbacteria bacterium Licking1014_2 TaxID=2017146 RepID=A0A554LVP1_9BACT|nr:MAG: hypothetical protein CEN88_257 [Candidatus Berkelbacteria bacterium Licking1014_2]
MSGGDRKPIADMSRYELLEFLEERIKACCETTTPPEVLRELKELKRRIVDLERRRTLG